MVPAELPAVSLVRSTVGLAQVKESVFSLMIPDAVTTAVASPEHVVSVSKMGYTFIVYVPGRAGESVVKSVLLCAIFTPSRK